MYYIAILLTIGANILYHISQKNIPEKMGPMFSLTITYSIALIISLTITVMTEGLKPLRFEIKEINWSCVLLGIAVVMLEVGFLLAYRAGWKIGTAAIVSNIIVTIALVPIGMFWFKEKINFTNIIGILLSLGGLYLINKK